MADQKLTDEQIENWRKVLFGMIGPYAAIMPVEKIEEMRDSMESRFAEMDDPDPDSEPLPYEVGDVVRVDGRTPLPYEVGDVVWVDGRTKAYVVKISPTKTQIKWGWGGRSFVDNNRIKTEKA